MIACSTFYTRSSPEMSLGSSVSRSARQQKQHSGREEGAQGEGGTAKNAGLGGKAVRIQSSKVRYLTPTIRAARHLPTLSQRHLLHVPTPTRGTVATHERCLSLETLPCVARSGRLASLRIYSLSELVAVDGPWLMVYFTKKRRICLHHQESLHHPVLGRHAVHQDWIRAPTKVSATLASCLPAGRMIPRHQPTGSRVTRLWPRSPAAPRSSLGQHFGSSPWAHSGASHAGPAASA